MTIDRGRLIKVLELLTSDHEGERSAAALKAAAMVREARTTFAEALNGQEAVYAAAVVAADEQRAIAERRVEELEDLVRSLQRREHTAGLSAYPNRFSAQQAYAPLDDHQTVAARIIHDHELMLSSFESDFLDSISRRSGTLTPKQAAVFARIRRKYGV